MTDSEHSDAQDDWGSLINGSTTIEDRRANHIKRHAIGVHAQMIREWGARNDGALPTRDDALDQAAKEVDLLLEALGPFSERNPFDYFIQSGRRERPLPHD